MSKPIVVAIGQTVIVVNHVEAVTVHGGLFQVHTTSGATYTFNIEFFEGFMEVFESFKK